jgi:hypothetical protein
MLVRLNRCLWIVVFFASIGLIRAQGPTVSFEPAVLAAIPQTHRCAVNTTNALWMSGRRDCWQPAFSADGRRVAYVTRVDRGQAVVVGDSVGPTFDEVGWPVWSPDSERVAYAARRGDPDKTTAWRIVVGDTEGPAFDTVGDPVFSPDGQTVAYAARRGRDRAEREMVVSGGNVVAEHDGVANVAFSPDGRLAYVRRTGRDKEAVCAVVLGEQEGPAFAWAGRPVFSRDGKHVAYPASRQPRGLAPRFLVIDGTSGPDVGMLLGLSLDANGRPVYMRSTKRGLNRWSVVVGDQAGEDFEGVSLPAVSADGGRVAYVGHRVSGMSRKAFLVVDGKSAAMEDAGFGLVNSPPVLRPGDYGLAFSVPSATRLEGSAGGFMLFDALDQWYLTGLVLGPEPGQLAYTNWSTVWAGGARSEKFDYAGTPVFSSDGRKVAFGARRDREYRWVVMNVK